MNRFIVPVITALLLAAPASATPILINGSFEERPTINGDVFDGLAAPGDASWAVFDTLPGWTAIPVGGPGIEVQTDGTLPTIDAQNGEHYVELDSTANATIRQSVQLTAGRYELSFWYSPRVNSHNDVAGPNTNGMTYAIAGFMGSVTGPGTTPLTQVGQWTQIVMSFVVGTTGMYNLDFAANTTSDSYGALIDNAAISAVPVPAAGGLLLLGLGGLAALRRRKVG